MSKVLSCGFHFPPIKPAVVLSAPWRWARHLQAWLGALCSPPHVRLCRVSRQRLARYPSRQWLGRSLALDAARHLAIGGRYRAGSRAGSWQTWMLGAIPDGMAMIRRHRRRLIWSTYPIVSGAFDRLTPAQAQRIPWSADFPRSDGKQDVRTGALSPAWPALRRTRLLRSREGSTDASALCFCYPRARGRFAFERYRISIRRWRVISNGFDESAFAEARFAGGVQAKDDSIVLLHSGTNLSSPGPRPLALFSRLARVLDQRPSGAPAVKVCCARSGLISLQRLIKTLRLSGICPVHPPCLTRSTAGNVRRPMA